MWKPDHSFAKVIRRPCISSGI